jgi:hypothetical protein
MYRGNKCCNNDHKIHFSVLTCADFKIIERFWRIMDVAALDDDDDDDDDDDSIDESIETVVVAAVVAPMAMAMATADAD